MVGSNFLDFLTDGFHGIKAIEKHDAFAESKKEILFIIGRHGDLSKYLVFCPVKLKGTQFCRPEFIQLLVHQSDALVKLFGIGTKIYCQHTRIDIRSVG